MLSFWKAKKPAPAKSSKPNTTIARRLRQKAIRERSMVRQPEILLQLPELLSPQPQAGQPKPESNPKSQIRSRRTDLGDSFAFDHQRLAFEFLARAAYWAN